MRAPLSRSRPPFFRGRGGVPVGDRALVGGLGLRGELLLGVAHLLAGGPHPGGFARRSGAPALTSSRRSFWAVSEGCWWA